MNIIGYNEEADQLKKRMQEMAQLINNEKELRKEQEAELLQQQLRNLSLELSIKKANIQTIAQLETNIENKRLQVKLTNQQLINKLKEASLTTEEDLQAEAENDLLQQQLSNIEELNKLRIAQINNQKKLKLQAELETSKKLIKLGLDEDKIKQKYATTDDKRTRKKYEQELKFIDQIRKNSEFRTQREELEKNTKTFTDDAFGKGKTWAERKAAWKEAFTNDEGEKDLKKGFEVLTKTLANFAQKLEQAVDEIASKKGPIDTRLQGSTKKWDDLADRVKKIATISPLIKQKDILDEIESMVKGGIAFNVEQRAFLNVVKNKIATTFDANNGVLLRLIRIQQQDSTAARLGMESAINSFLNNMYETSEYLTDVATSVKSNLEEAQALMSTTEAISFEYQVQKWLGSMYSVGMSQSAVTKISDILGKISSGDITGLTEGGVSNLLIMAANQANLSIADILAKGLNDSETNTLLNAAVDYLSQIYAESGESKVLQQQFASIFGVAASDLKAAANLTKDNGITQKNISRSMLDYSSAMGQLLDMANSMYSRTSIGEMFSNMWDNFNYTLAGGLANNPVLYALYKVAGLLDDLVGGIPLPFINVWGFGIDLNTTVADLMKVGALAGSVFSAFGSLFSGGGGLTGAGLLKAAGIDTSKSSLNTVSRGSGLVYSSIGGNDVSESGYVGNASGGDVKEKTLSDASEDSDAQLAEAKEDEDADIERKVLNENILNIYDLLQKVIDGTSVVNVKVLDYGLTGWN